MNKKILGQIRIAGLFIVLGLNLSTIYSCSDNRASNSNSRLLKSINEERLLNELVDKYLSKLNARIKSDFDSTAVVVQVGLDSSARIEAFRPFWLNKIVQLRASDSVNYIFYDSLFKLKLKEHTKLRKYSDSINFFKAQLRILENKLDSAARGLFGNPVLKQFARLSNEKGNVYFLSTQINYKDDKTLSGYFGIEELEKDTIITFNTYKSLAEFMWTAVYRRNSSFWTKGQKKINKKEKGSLTA